MAWKMRRRGDHPASRSRALIAMAGLALLSGCSQNTAAAPRQTIPSSVPSVRAGTELATAYQDTLGDEVLGTLGAFVGAVVVSRRVGKGAGTTHRPVR